MALGDTQLERLRLALDRDTFAGRFDVLGEVGHGGMGTVYRAVESATNRPLAIKVLHERTAAMRARFTAEVEVLERMDHAAIVAYVSHGVTSAGEPYLAMAWLDGDNLATRLARGRLSVVESVAVARRLAAALAHAHAAGVVHRDLKPSNVVLADGDVTRATLIDFGIAKDTALADGMTVTGQVVGTPGYMAPEQALGKSTIDARTDLFALGGLLFECLTGKPPFEGAAVFEVVARMLLEEPPRPSSLEPAIPPRLDALVLRLLAKQADDRIAEATVVERELAAIALALETDDRDALAASAFARPASALAHPGPSTSADLADTVDLAPPRGARSPARTLRISRRRPRRRALAIAAAIVGTAAVVAWIAAARSGTAPAGAPTLAGSANTPAHAEAGTDVEESVAAREVSKHACEAIGLPECRTACDAGDATACRSYGRTLHAISRDDPQQKREALLYLQRGCRLGSPGACTLAGTFIRRRVLSGDSGYDRATWQAMLERGCALDSPTACTNLATYLLSDGEVARDVPLRHFLRACELGLIKGCSQALELIRGGAGSADDKTVIRSALQRACDHGARPMCLMLEEL